MLQQAASQVKYIYISNDTHLTVSDSWYSMKKTAVVNYKRISVFYINHLRSVASGYLHIITLRKSKIHMTEFDFLCLEEKFDLLSLKYEVKLKMRARRSSFPAPKERPA